MANPLDLELNVERGDNGAYEVTLRARLDAENEWEEGPFVVEIDLAGLRALVGNPEGYGRTLSGCLFTNADLRAAFAAARGRAGDGGMRLRIRTARNAPELQRVQWELMTDPESTGFLSTREDVVLSRYLARDATSGSAALPGRKAALRWLAAVANPSNLTQKYELAAIDVAVEQDRVRGLAGVEVVCLPDPTPGAVMQRCTLENLIERARDVDVLYLACHGRMINDAPWLLLEDESGLAARISGKRLVEAIQGLASKPRLIVLASCESGGGTGDVFSAIGPRLVAAGVPAVVAMQGLVTITLVQDFMPVFFRELVRDGRIDRALAFARRAVSGDHPDWWSPVLYMNLRSGQLWQEIEIAPNTGDPSKPGTTVIGSSNIVIGDITNASGITIIAGGPVQPPQPAIPHEIKKPDKAFFGRKSELSQMREVVCDQELQAIEVWGFGGTGKTMLAQVLVDDIMDSFPDGQVYLNLRGQGGLPDSKEQMPITPVEAIRSVFDSFGIDAGPVRLLANEAEAEDERERLEGIYQTRLSDKRAILLLDNAANEKQVTSFLSPPGQCLVIITAWQRFTTLPGLWDISLGKMDIEEAKAMFMSLAPRVDHLVEELVIACDLLPSAIQLWAGILHATPNITPEFALRELTSENEKPPMLLRLGEGALSISYDMLNPQQQEEWRKLAVLPLEFDEFDAAAVWGLLLPGAVQEEKETAWFDASQRLASLINYNLVEFNAATRHYSLLNIFRPYARIKMSRQEADQARAALAAYRAG